MLTVKTKFVAEVYKTTVNVVLASVNALANTLHIKMLVNMKNINPTSLHAISEVTEESNAIFANTEVAAAHIPAPNA